MQQPAKHSLDRLQMAIKDGSCTLIAGYGLSALNVDVPRNWKTILDEIDDWYRLEKLQGKIPETEIRPKQETSRGELIGRKETITAKEVATTLDHYLKDPLQLRRCLRNILLCHKTEVSKTHELIVEYPFRAYLTTNYDAFIEVAYAKKRGKDLATFYVDEVRDIADHMKEIQEPFVLKLCGDIGRPNSLSTDLDLSKRLMDTDHPLTRGLHGIIGRHHVLCIGFEPENPDYYCPANLCKGNSEVNINYWIAVPRGQEIKPPWSELGKDIHVIPYDSLQEFIEQLLSSPSEEVVSDLLRPTANGEVPVNGGSASNILPLRKTGPLQAPQPQPKEDVTVTYVDFHLQIAPDGHIRAQSEEGEGKAKISAKIPRKLQEMLTQIEQPQATEEEIKKCGISLYKHIFPDQVHTRFSQTMAVARSHHNTIRIRLTIEPDTLADLPWEFIYHEDEGYFLAANPDTVLSRYINLPMPRNYVRQREGPLHLLVIIANPLSASSSPTNWEAIINDALMKPLQKNLITIDFVKHATYRNITDALLKQLPDMIQFIGRSIYENGKGSLVLVKNQKEQEWLVDSQRFASIFQGFGRTLGLVSLMTYENESINPHHSLLNIAPQLVIQGIPAVVAMRYSVSASTAAIYLEDFYTSIAARRPADWAVQQARKALHIQQELDHKEFAAPVLYMRAEDGNIFD